MKDEIMQRIISVINALNNVTVKGEQNLANLSGSITVLKEAANLLSSAKFAEECGDGGVK